MEAHVQFTRMQECPYANGYLVPTSADIPKLDVLFVGEFDAEASPIGAKGLGELYLGISSACDS